MSKRKSIEKIVTFSDVVCGRKYRTMGYSKDVLFKGDPVKEDLEDPFEDNYVDDETAINVVKFLDGALVKLTEKWLADYAAEIGKRDADLVRAFAVAVDGIEEEVAELEEVFADIVKEL